MKNVKYFEKGKAKDIDAEVAVGEGVPIGKTQTGKSPEKVREAKENPRAQRKAYAENVRLEMSKPKRKSQK